MSKHKLSANDITLCAMLVALALGLSYAERLLGLQAIVPLPGIKLGLANIVTLTALYFLGTKTAFTVLVLRCLLGSIFGGGPSALIFSLTGGLLALTVMAVLRQVRFLSVYGVSVCGAAAHNVGQIAAAMLVMKSTAALGYLPLLLFMSLATGFVTGAVCSSVFKALRATGRYPVMGGTTCLKTYSRTQ
ncbi:MAG: Gx transporter family protein [Oscillospiraceae bacterium]